LTRAATFAQKADLFPGSVFAVGADTAARIVALRFYDGSAEKMDQALAAIRKGGCRFLVAGRKMPDGNFLDLAGLAMPPSWRDLFTAVPADMFRLDVSSTKLRVVDHR
jgi:hypothetical protein